MSYIIEKSYVYVVLEHYHRENIHYVNCIKGVEFDARVHGVYTTRNMAEGKLAKLTRLNCHNGYISILKKPINGKIDKVEE